MPFDLTVHRRAKSLVSNPKTWFIGGVACASRIRLNFSATVKKLFGESRADSAAVTVEPVTLMGLTGPDDGLWL